MKKKQPTKRKILLSKEDLVELLTVLKNFIQEELLQRGRESERLTSIEQRRMRERITRLEIETKKVSEVKQVSYCGHEDRFESIWYSLRNIVVMGLRYKCRWCGRELIKTTILLSWREKRNLRKLGVEI